MRTAESSTTSRPSLPAVLIAAAAAVVANLVLLAVGRGAGASMQAGDIAVGIRAVIAATLMGFAVGTGLLLLLARRSARAARVLAGLGLAVGVLSAAAPLLMADDLVTGIVLAGMHIMTGAAWFLGAPRRRG